MWSRKDPTDFSHDYWNPCVANSSLRNRCGMNWIIEKISSSSAVCVLLERPSWLIMLTSICAVFLSLIETRLMVQRLSFCGKSNTLKAVKSTKWVLSHIDPPVSNQWPVWGRFENHMEWMSNRWIICLSFDTNSTEKSILSLLSAFISFAPFRSLSLFSLQQLIKRPSIQSIFSSSRLCSFSYLSQPVEFDWL